MTDVLLVLAMMLVTFIPRYLPFALASRLKLPKGLEQALGYVPIAVLTVIIVQTAFYTEGKLHFSYQNAYLWASLVAFILALIQKQLFVTIVGGLGCYAVLKFMVFI